MPQQYIQKNATSNNLSRFLKRKITGLSFAIIIGCSFFVSNVSADSGMSDLKKVMQGQLKMMKPELQAKVEGLSMDTKMSLMSILAMHNRYSKKATLRQVMLEVFSDYQSMIMGVMTGSAEMTADSARRLANHRIPVGGLLPYMGMDNVTDARLSMLEGFNTTVEGNAHKVAEAADNGDMNTAISLIGTIGAGCVGCHEIFRPGAIGASDLLR